ncbi:cytochrome P450 [Streptomyces sp. GC420]|uniref:cytochrome P450 n=1 Tax=Streptomyces sp. GC420 TaxID=2697568 RepID=UPI001414ECE5|nr:cytochrome P450 [Streptomyces sp. GC420]NBM18907.1 cytochrome P450 [Streptomyces sp. GC420]
MSRLRSPKGQADPYPLYSELRGLGNVVPAPWGGHLLTSYEACDYVVRHSQQWLVPDAAWRFRQLDSARWTTSSSGEMGKSLPYLNPPEHTRQRRSLGNLFGRAGLDSFAGPVQDTVDLLLDRLEERMRDGEADFASLVSEKLPIITVGRWLGLPEQDHELLSGHVHSHVYPQELGPTRAQLAAADTATQALNDYFTALIQERRRSLGTDTVSQWIRLWDEREPDRERADENVYFLVKFIVMAALETTSTLLSSMVWLLDQNPGQREFLRDHPEYVPDAIDECLRYDPPIHVYTRIAAEPTEISGVRVEKDEMVYAMVGAAHHDPAQYERPGVFDIRRGGPHLGFSGGVHYCLGAPLARLKATALLTSLLRRFPTLRVGATPTWEAPRLAFRRLASLPVVAR